MNAALIAHSSGVAHFAMLIGGIGAVIGYGVWWWRTPSVSNIPLAAWASGVLALLLALAPPFERLAQETFTGHMVQHLVLMVVAAPLLVVGAPPAHAWRTRPRAGRSTRRVIRSWSPVLGAAAFVGVLTITHLTSLYDVALRRQAVHDLEHVAFLGSAMVLWAAVRAGGRRQSGQRLGAVFGVIVGTALVSMVILTADLPLVATYERHLGAAQAVADQHRAAALMWVSGMAITLPLLIAAVWGWAARDEEIARRREAMTEHEVPHLTR